MRKIRIFLYLKKLWRNKLPNKKHCDGQLAEKIARKYLKKHRIKIIDKNFFCRLGEIDIIGLQSNMVIFVEVRFRSDSNFGSAEHSITKAKQKKIIRASQYWLTKNQMHNKDIRFDAILFNQQINYQHITWLKAVF